MAKKTVSVNWRFLKTMANAIFLTVCDDMKLTLTDTGLYKKNGAYVRPYHSVRRDINKMLVNSLRNPNVEFDYEIKSYLRDITTGNRHDFRTV